MSADVWYGDRPQAKETLWYDIPASLGDGLGRSGNAWLTGLLPLACALAEPLVVDAPVDPVLYENARELMDAWHFRFPEMTPVPVEFAGSPGPGEPAPTRTAQFFSGGVDSLFTTLRHAVPGDPVQVDDLLFCMGFDIPLSEQDALARVETRLAETAADLGKNLVVVATNLRDTRFAQLKWAELSHGCAMASVGLLLEAKYRRLLIPSTDGYRETGPWGSHAMTDHLFSTSSTRVIHDGSAHSRLQKVELLAQSPAALKHLRVCWRSASDRNCGECEKCYRTMIALDLCGALQQAHSFAHAELDLERVGRIYCPEQKVGSVRLYYEELLDRARERGREDLAAALRRALRRSARASFLLDQVNALFGVPLLGRFARPIARMLKTGLVE